MKICRCSKPECLQWGCILTRPTWQETKTPLDEQWIRQIVREEIERFKDDNK